MTVKIVYNEDGTCFSVFEPYPSTKELIKEFIWRGHKKIREQEVDK